LRGEEKMAEVMDGGDGRGREEGRERYGLVDMGR
jgi:hypothetical protein